MSGMLSYFGIIWNIAQQKVKDTNCMCAILDNKLFVISNLGNNYMDNLIKDG